MNKSIFLTLCSIYFSILSFSMDIDYELGMSNPSSHYFEVKMNISNIKSKSIEVKMPVWAPGSYLEREFAKGINILKAKDANGNELSAKKTNKNTWLIDSKGLKSIIVSYEVYSFELSVRTSFLDDTHGYLNGTSIFMYVAGNKDVKGTVNIKPHKSFKKISTSMKNEGNNVYSFKDYDELVDSPIEIGNQIEFHFDAAGVDHTVAMYGEGNYDIPTLQKDMAKIVEAETIVMGENPNKEYLFIIHNITVPSGGLEHKKSTTLEVNRWTYGEDGYIGFLSLVAHEYFHLWNVKRMRPKSLGPFDYDKENYTDLLWVMEGFTSYYDELILRRAGFYSEDEYLNILIGTINYVENQPGNKVQPVAHSSFDAWIKAYRRTENSFNTTISYYSKGQILAAMLDLHIINKFDGKKGLDDFLQKLYKDFYKKNDIGFTEDEFQATLESFLEEEMDWFFDDYVYDTKVPDYKKFFKGVGLKFYNSDKQSNPFLGVRTANSGGKLVITGVFADSPGEKAGLSVNDEIIAFDGYRVNQGTFTSMLDVIDIGESFELLIARDNIIKTYKLKMGSRNTKRYAFDPDFDDESRRRFDYWLRVDVF